MKTKPVKVFCRCKCGRYINNPPDMPENKKIGSWGCSRETVISDYWDALKQLHFLESQVVDQQSFVNEMETEMKNERQAIKTLNNFDCTHEVIESHNNGRVLNG